MKISLYIIVAVAFLLVTFFGIGPVLLADGSKSERLITLLIVVLLYIILGWIIVKIRKHNKNIKK